MRVKEQSRLKWPYHSFSRALPMSTATPLLVKLSSLGHQAHTEQLVHHACARSLGCELLQDVTQHICEKSVFVTESAHKPRRVPSARTWSEMHWDAADTVSSTVRVFVLLEEHLQLLLLLLSPKDDPGTLPFNKQTKGLFKKRFAGKRAILTHYALNTNNAVWTRSSTYFCFLSSLALSTRPMRTSCVTTCRRVRVLLLSNGSRVSTISGTKHKKWIHKWRALDVAETVFSDLQTTKTKDVRTNGRPSEWRCSS